MLKDLFSNRLFMGALLCLVLIVVGGVLYLKHVERQAQQVIQRNAPVEPPATTHASEPVRIVPETPAPVTQENRDADKQALLYLQRRAQYIRDFAQWREKYQQARNEWLQVVKDGENIAPHAPQEYIEYMRSLSDTERKEVVAKLEANLEKVKAAVKKRNAVSQERPVPPTPPQNN